MAPVKPSGQRRKTIENADALRARLIERGVHIEAAPPPASAAAGPKASAAPTGRPTRPPQRVVEPAQIVARGDAGLGLEGTLIDVEGDGGEETGARLADGGADPVGATPAGMTNVVAERGDSCAAPAAVPVADTAARARSREPEPGAEAATLVTPSLTLTSEEEETLLADTLGGQQPEDPRAVLVWEIRRELEDFERNVHAQRQAIQDRLATAEEALKAQRRSERVADYARLGLTLSRAGLGWEAVTALRDVPAADLLTLVHTLAKRGLSVRDLLSRVPPAKR